MSKHNALTLAGGTGGEYEQRHYIGIDRIVEVKAAVLFKDLLAAVYKSCKIVGSKIKRYGGHYKLTNLCDSVSLVCDITVGKEECCLSLCCGLCKVVCLPVTVKGYECATRHKH